MKIVVSYINSIDDTKTTIKKIDACKNVDGIHVDLMDGKYVPTKNFDISELSKLFEGITKPLDIHLMVDKPTQYFNELFKLHPSLIYIHPKTERDPILVFKYLQVYNIAAGLVINPEENIADFEKYFPYIKRVLLMSVTPGAGGQKFMPATSAKLDKLKIYQVKYNFEIFIDGGINDITILSVIAADGVVSGSFICQHENYDVQVSKLQNILNHIESK